MIKKYKKYTAFGFFFLILFSSTVGQADLNLLWNPIPGTQKYMISFSKEANTYNESFDTTANHCSVSQLGLTDHAIYYLKIEAIDSGGASIWESDEITLTTDGSAIPSGLLAPQGFKIISN